MHDIQQMLEEKRAKARLGGGEQVATFEHPSASPSVSPTRM